jgi:hypothetical protein
VSTQTQEKEELLATDLQLVSLLKNNPDILLRHPELVAELEVPHESGVAVSLIERQVVGLREKLKDMENKMRELMGAAKDNDRLAQSRHRLALNLLNAHDLDDVISTISDELWAELKADFVNVRLFTNNEGLIKDNPDLFVSKNDESVNCFSTMLKHKNPMCGHYSDEQKTFLFGDDATLVKSAAVIPLSAGAELGLLGLGSDDETRFELSMGTDFLIQIGELISASLAVHLEE